MSCWRQRVMGQAVSTLVFAAALLTLSCARHRDPCIYEVPESYRGWVEIKFEVPTCPPLPRRDGKYLIVLSSSGQLCTRTAPEYGVAVDEFYLVGTNRRRVAPSGWGQGGMIWGGRFGGGARETIERFFVGTEEEYKKESAKPEPPEKGKGDPQAR